MIQNLPDASLSKHSHLISSPEDKHGGIDICSNVSYETNNNDEEDKMPPPPVPKKTRQPKKKCDPNIPKGSLTANQLYVNSNQARAKEEVSDTISFFYRHIS